VTQKRVVVDSSGWIEVFTDGEHAEHFLALMADERALVVPAISIFEVYKWVLREHGEAQAIQAAAVMQSRSKSAEQHQKLKRMTTVATCPSDHEDQQL